MSGTASLEIHLPISPTPGFFTMVHYFAASLRLHGGSLADSRIVVTIGADCEPEDLDARLTWSRRYAIEWSWMDRATHRRLDYYGTAVERFRHPFGARAVMLADADTFFTGSFESIVAQCHSERALAGLVAHQSPFKDAAHLPTPETWSRVFAAAGLRAPAFECQHTGWLASRDAAEDRYCPPYFNLGMLIAPADVMARIGEVIYEEMAHVQSVVDTHYRCQMAVSLAVQRLSLPHLCLPMRYNCANDDAMLALHPGELADVRLFHYLRRGQVDKTTDFASAADVERLLARPDLSGVNREMVRRLAAVHDVVRRDLAALDM